MFHEVINLKGHLEIVLFGNDGIEKDRRSVDNLVTTAGKVFIASRMDGTSSGAMSHMAVGTSTTSAAVGQTALVSESARVAEDSSTPSSATIIYVATFPAGTATAALTEAGILNASSGGTLLCRTVFSVINKGASDSLTITWTITIS
jgi:hypothetical protein